MSDAALQGLIARDPRLKRALELAGAPPSRVREGGFAALLRIIAEQQVSVAAGAAIWARTEATLGTVSAEVVAGADEDTLRACGLSRPKIRYARALAEAVVTGTLDLDALAREPDDAVIRRALTAIPGIGRWTADIYMMFCLGHPDVWPAGDLALQVAVQRLLELPERPGIGQMDAIASHWKPWRSTAALVLWRYYRALGG